MAEQQLSPLEELDQAFVLPESVDERWRGLYEVLVARLRREATALPMSTIQVLLIERIAYNYIVLRIKEGLAMGEGGFAHATAQKEFNTFWLSMTQEFNRQTRQTDKEFREATMQAAAKVVRSVIAEVEDPELRSRLSAKLTTQLEEAGL